jgi:hypothetical protein
MLKSNHRYGAVLNWTQIVVFLGIAIFIVLTP